MGYLEVAAEKFTQWLGMADPEEIIKEYLSFEAEYQGGPVYEDGCFVFPNEEKPKMEIPVYVPDFAEIKNYQERTGCGIQEAQSTCRKIWRSKQYFVKVPRKMLQSILDRLDALENSPSITVVNQTIYSGKRITGSENLYKE